MNDNEFGDIRLCVHEGCGQYADSDAPWGLGFCPAHYAEMMHMLNQQHAARRGFEAAVDAKKSKHRNYSSRCPNGHKYSWDNTGMDRRGARVCLTCELNNIAAKSRREMRTHCRRGHAMTEENARYYTKADGRVYQVCRACNIENNRASRARAKQAA